MRIVVGSYYRTGSTWLYNAVRLSCLTAGKSVRVEGYGKLIEYEEDVCIHKIHTWNERLERAASHVFNISRDIRDADASFEKAFDHPIDPAHRALSLKAHEKWRAAAPNPFHFDQIKSDPMYILARISMQLSLGFRLKDIISVHEQLTALKPPIDREQDPESLYFTRHITSNE